MTTTTTTTRDMICDRLVGERTTLVDSLIYSLTARYDEGAAIRTELAQRIADGYRVTNMWGLNWEALATHDIVREFVDDVPAGCTVKAYVDQVRVRVNQLRNAIMEGWMDPNSTSPVSNGFSAVQLAAARSFVKYFGEYADRCYAELDV